MNSYPTLSDIALINQVRWNADVWNCDENEESFHKTWGQDEVTLIHIASYSGRLDVLKRANALHLDLYLQNKLDRCALHYAASQGHFYLVKLLMERAGDLSKLHLKDCDGRTALHLAVARKHVEVVELLVNAEVDVNIRDKFRKTPLHLAWVNIDRDDPAQMLKYINIVKKLTSSPGFEGFIDEAEEGRASVIHGAAHLNSPEIMRLLLERGIIFPRQYESQTIPTPLHILAEHGFHTTMRTLLRNRGSMALMMESRNIMGLTPLHVAVSRGHMKCAYVLVRHGGSLLSVTKDGLTVIDILFRDQEHRVRLLTELLDACVYTPNVGFVDESFLDLSVLASGGDNKQMAVVSALLSVLSSTEQINVLPHPVVEAFVEMKWRRMAPVLLVFVIFQMLFINWLYSYGHALTRENDSHTTPRRKMFVGAIITLCRNIAQLHMIPKYFSENLETGISVITASICIVVAIAGEFGFDHPEHNSGQTSSWLLQSVTIAIILACIELMLILGQCRALANFTLIFCTAVKNLSKVLGAIFYVTIGFALSFSILFHDNDQFNSPWKAFVKTVVMMMGEYEYSDLFEYRINQNSTANETYSNMSQTTLSPITGRIVFLLFIMLASIVMLNITVGLAIDDMQKLMNKSLMLQLRKQVISLTLFEQVTSRWIFQCRWVPTFLKTALHLLHNIPTRIRIEIYLTWRRKYSRGVSEELETKLRHLVLKNRNLKKKTSKASVPQNYEDIALTSDSEEEGSKPNPWRRAIEGVHIVRRHLERELQDYCKQFDFYDNGRN